MKYFTAAAHHKSLSKAATAMNISQSAISLAVDSLEKEIGLDLLIRQRSKGVLLTVKGQEVLTRIQSILDQVDSFERDMKGLQEDISGDLHIGCFTPLGPIVLVPILERMGKAHQAIRANITEGNVRSIFDDIHRGTVDVGISYDEADISAGLKTKTLAVVPPHVVIPYDHPLADLPAIPLSALIDQPLILLDLPSSRQYYTSLFEAAGFHPKFAYKSGNFEMIRSMVGAGIGLAILQTCPPMDFTQSGTRVVCKPIQENLRKSRLVVAYTRQAIKRSSVRAFVQHCEAYFTTEDSRKLIVPRQ